MFAPALLRARAPAFMMEAGQDGPSGWVYLNVYVGASLAVSGRWEIGRVALLSFSFLPSIFDMRDVCRFADP